jgi:transposase
MGQICVGVDTGKSRHQAAAYDVEGATWVGQLSFAVGRTGFDQFSAFLRGLAPTPGEVLVGLEATGHYHLTLAEYLTNAGYQVVLLDPYRAAQFRRSEGHKAKTDRIDARALARFLTLQPARTVIHPDTQLVALRELTRFRADLVRDRSSALNRLRATLDLAFPELLSVFRLLGKPTVLTLLLSHPTAAAVAAADRGELLAVVRGTSHAHLGERSVDALVAAAETSVALCHGQAALGLKVQALARQVLALNAEVAAVEQSIEQEFNQLGFTARQFPVGTAVSLAALIAEAGNVRRFPTAKQFVAHFGWCPVDVQSGHYQRAHPRLSRAGNRYIRRLIWMLAVSAVRYPGLYRTYLDRRTAVGKNKMHSLVAIGRKLLSTVYAILKTGRPFDPAYAPG